DRRVRAVPPRRPWGGRDRARPERRSPVRFRAGRPREARAPRQGEDGNRGGRGMNDEVKFLTHEIGSLAKPPWLVKTSAGKPLDGADLEHARVWGERLEVPGFAELVELLQGGPGNGDAHEVARWSSRYAVRLLESAGLDLVYDG